MCKRLTAHCFSFFLVLFFFFHFVSNHLAPYQLYVPNRWLKYFFSFLGRECAFCAVSPYRLEIMGKQVIKPSFLTEKKKLSVAGGERKGEERERGKNSVYVDALWCHIFFLQSNTKVLYFSIVFLWIQLADKNVDIWFPFFSILS